MKQGGVVVPDFFVVELNNMVKQLVINALLNMSSPYVRMRTLLIAVLTQLFLNFLVFIYMYICVQNSKNKHCFLHLRKSLGHATVYVTTK